MSTDTNAITNPEREAKAKKLKNFLDKLVQENKLASEYVDVIMQESIKHNFNGILSSTDEQISYTGWLSVTSVGGGGYVFSSWSGDFSMTGWLAPAVGTAFFFYARMEIFTQYNYDMCKGTMSFQLTPIAMSLDFAMGDKGDIPVGEGVAGGPALAVGAGGGDFTILKR